MVEEARKLFESDKVDAAITKAQEALNSAGDGLVAGSALGLLLTCQLSKGEVSVEGALSKIKDEASKLGKIKGKLGDGAMALATGEVYMAAGEYEKALKAGSEAVSIFGKEGHNIKEAEALYKIVVGAYVENSNAEKAVTSATSALSLTQREGDKKAEAEAWLAVAEARFAEGTLTECMDACTSALDLFKPAGNKYKEAMVHCLVSQVHMANEDPQASLSSARDALSCAKDCSSGLQAAAAVELMVEAEIACGFSQDGLSDAEKELAALKATGNQRGVAEMMCAVVVATTAVRGPNAGFEAVKQYVVDCRDAGNLQGQVKMLHRMAMLAEHADVAMNTAQAAMKLAESIGDVFQQSKIKVTLTDLWVAQGKLHKAPLRKQALGLLNQLAKDLQNRDVESFQDTNKKLNKYWNALTEMDMKSTVHKVIQRDPQSSMEFLKENGLIADERAKREGPVTGHRFRHVPVPNLYMGFRIGGLGYGPRYRVCCANKTLHAPEAMGIVELQDASDDWERELGYSPSLLDGCLQTGAAMGH